MKIKLNKLIEGQNFISDKHDKMANDYKSALTKSRKQKEETNKLNKRADELQKKVTAKNLNYMNSNNTTADKIWNWWESHLLKAKM